MSDLQLDPKATALVLIDLQNGLKGMLLAPHTFDEVVAKSAQLASALRAKGGTIVWVRVNISDMLPRIVDNPSFRNAPGAPPPPASASELLPECDVQPADILITKRSWGAFIGTGLDEQLRTRGIHTILLGGVATNFGVESTARSASDFGIDIVFVEDAMSTVSAEAHTFATQLVFPRLGRVRTTEQVLAAL